MADQVASLVVEVDASGAKKAAVDLDTLAKAADRADNAANDLADSSRKLSAAEQTVANEAKRAMEGVSHLAAEQEAAVKTAQRLNAAHGSAVISSKALNQATLNLGRQFADIGTSLGSGMSPLMVLIQQGPQITDIFAQLKTQGIGAGAAFQAMGASLAPALPLILGIGAAVGVVVGAFALFERAVDKETKHATTFGDTWKATLKVTGDYIMDGPIGDGLKWLGGAFSKTLDFIVDGVTSWYDRTVGLFIAAYKTITTHWKDLPAAFGAIMTGAANGVIGGIQFIVDGAMKAINYFRKKAGMDEFARVEIPKLTQANNAAARDFEKYWTEATANVRKSREGFASDVAKQADKEFEKRQKAKKATEDHTKAIKANAVELVGLGDDALAFVRTLEESNAKAGMSAEAIRRLEIQIAAAMAPTEEMRDRILAAGRAWEEHNRVAKESAEILGRVKAAANDNIRVFDAAGVSIPTALENMATEAERVAAQTREITWGVEDIADAINRNDWTSAFSSLARVLVQVQNAFKQGTDSATKFRAAAALAQGVGNVIGGSTGSAISATASGALTGFQLGGPVGAVIGGGIGLVTSLFGSSKAKKQQRAQEAAQRAAEEAARQQQISDTTFSLNVALLEAQGKAEEALAMTRQRELDALAKLDPALVALQQQLYAAEDAASAAAKEAEAQAQALQKEIAVRQTQRGVMLQLMALDDAVTGGNSAVLAARQDELAALDPVSRQLKEIYYARLDEGEALAKQASAVEAATKAQEEAAQAAEAFQQANIGLMRQLMAMDDAVLGTTSARDAARADELAKLDETGRKLQTIIWARQDEAEVIAKQQAATEAATAAAEEAARKTAEILKQRTDLENQLLAALGMTALATERQRTAMLESLDPSLRGYQTLLYGVEDATAAVTAAESALADARSAASQAYEREASALQATIDKFKSFSASLKSFRGSLDTGGLAMNDPMQQYARTKADFERVAGLAAAGNEDALGSLQGVSEAYLEASKAAQATNVGYFKDLGAVKRATEAAQKYADQQVDQNTAQLSALQSQVSALGILNQSTLSVGQAVTNVAAAIDALARATSAKSAAEAAAKQALSSAGVIPKATQSLNDTSRQVMISANDNAALAAAKVYYNSANGGVDSALFNRYFANDPFGKSVGFTGDPEELRRRYGFATGGSFTVGGSGPPDSQVFPLHLSPGEMVNVSRPGQGGNAELVAELRALRQEVAELKAAQIQTTINTGRQVRLAERWDGDGLPETRSVA